MMDASGSLSGSGEEHPPDPRQAGEAAGGDRCEAAATLVTAGH